MMKAPGFLTFAFFFITCTLFGQEKLAPTTATTQPTITLISPPAAQTDESVAVLWDKPAGTGAESYDVYIGPFSSRRPRAQITPCTALPPHTNMRSPFGRI